MSVILTAPRAHFSGLERLARRLDVTYGSMRFRTDRPLPDPSNASSTATL